MVGQEPAGHLHLLVGVPQHSGVVLTAAASASWLADKLAPLAGMFVLAPSHGSCKQLAVAAAVLMQATCTRLAYHFQRGCTFSSTLGGWDQGVQHVLHAWRAACCHMTALRLVSYQPQYAAGPLLQALMVTV
jgi:hypothetical protein